MKNGAVETAPFFSFTASLYGNAIESFDSDVVKALLEPRGNSNS